MHDIRFILFLYSDVYHQALLSFPTRRSSDLSSTYSSTARRAMPCANGGTRRIRTSASGAQGRPATPFAQGIARDGKSTRLNSSHQINSYVVFSLYIKDID